MQAKKVGSQSTKVWIARFLIVIVIFLNLQAAIQYLLNPNIYSGSFELQGVPGMAAVRGVGILYMMWQVPYIVAAINPVAHRLSSWEAVSMQAIGLVGETWLRSRIPIEHTVLRSSLMRYILFDAGGLVLLLIALILVNTDIQTQKKGKEAC